MTVTRWRFSLMAEMRYSAVMLPPTITMYTLAPLRLSPTGLLLAGKVAGQHAAMIRACGPPGAEP